MISSRKMDRIWILMAKKIAGEATDDELKELSRLLTDEPDLHYPFTIIDELRDCRHARALPPAEEALLLQKGLRQLEASITASAGKEAVQEALPPHPQRDHFRKKAVPVFALLIVVAVMGYLALTQHNNAGLKNEIATKSGSKTTIVLPDGTRVWLNACSQLQYADGFVNGKRVVTLKGEGFFEVEKDEDHPFIIHAGGIDIKVLGTTLNVKAYPGDPAIETSLVSGKVEVDLKDNTGQKIILKPDQKITILKSLPPETQHPLPGVKQEKEKVDFAVTTLKKDAGAATFPETAWIDNKLEFSQETFEQLARELERQYNIQIYFEDDKYKNEVFSGIFKNQPVQEILHALQLTSDFHYRTDSLNNIHIW